MDCVREVIFPGIYCQMPDAKESLYEDLTELIGPQNASSFMADIPEIRSQLLTDVEAIASNDPAATNVDEVIACYPGLDAILHYRIAHRLLEMDIPILPRFITELAHSSTGIDIHPAAKIGEYFAIDHGTGIVIGATAVIGSHVMLYQGVTLGARNFVYDEKGHPLDVPRHPILEDNVTVYSNTSILGHVRIGHDTVIGGNIWLTHDVPPHSRILQSHAIYASQK